MPRLKMFIGLRIRSKVKWVQNNKIIDKALLSMPSHACITSIYSLQSSRMYLRKVSRSKTWNLNQRKIWDWPVKN